MSHVLYRFFGSDGTLLYVGRTHRIDSRFSAHKKQKPWREIARIELAHFDDHHSLCLAESAAIRSENPVWNRVRPGESAPDTPDPQDSTRYATIGWRAAKIYQRANKASRFGDPEWGLGGGDASGMYDGSHGHDCPSHSMTFYPDVVSISKHEGAVGGYSCWCGKKWVVTNGTGLFDWEYRLFQEVMSLRAVVVDLMGVDKEVAKGWTYGYVHGNNDYLATLNGQSRWLGDIEAKRARERRGWR